jgi:organic radical activating enzyme
MNSEVIKFYRSVKESLDSVGAGMCLAKWYQVTLHLENGHNHSCHHPKTHQTPLHELAQDPSSLHNTKHKQRMRELMLDGRRPQECRYCWNVEDTIKDENNFSDRILKSAAYPLDRSNAIAQTKLLTADPTHLEVSFSTTCNFACSYCSADVSSSWMKELKKHGPFKTEFPLITLEQIESDNKIPIPDHEHNPYIEAFWKWWPELYKSLKVARITGGEPLLSSHTFKIFDYIEQHPRSDLDLAINSNMGVPRLLIERFASKVQNLLSNNKIKKFTLFTSCEAHGDHANYIRHGMNYNDWYDNCTYFLQTVPDTVISIMVTYNAMSVVSYLRYLQDVTRLKKQFPNRVRIDTSYMANPKCLTIDILPKEFLKYFELQERYVKLMYDNKLFDEWELLKIQRLKNYFQSRLEKPMEALDMFRRDFKVFVDEHDRRRNTNFLETFPQMQEFYNLCARS